MRRPIRPFTVERKRSGRPAPAGEPPVLDLPPPPPAPAEKPAEAPRWAAAEALFAAPAPAQPGASAPSAVPARRILPSLIEAPAQAPDREAEDAPPRRGRKPAARSKPPRAGEAHGPKTVETVMRNVFEFWSREDEAAEIDPAAAPRPAPALILRRRGRVPRGELPRGERWKARLPRFAR